jgi:hypothetical protein
MKCVPFIFNTLYNIQLEDKIYSYKEVLELLKRHHINCVMYYDFSLNYMYNSDLDYVNKKAKEILNNKTKEFLVFTLENDILHVVRSYKSNIICSLSKYDKVNQLNNIISIIELE